jgi:NAD(P)-dependent dehydrogenase (short-subunit alcohol dehydrogenase family)
MQKDTFKRFDLTGKVALVAGGGGYLGKPICRALAEHGAHVIIADINKESADNASSLLAKKGFSTEAIKLDIGNEKSVIDTINSIVTRHNRLDIVVNLTFYSTGKPMDKMDLTDWEKGLRVSLSGAFVLSRETGRVMVSQGSGSIIQFSSMYGKISPDPRIYKPHYSVNPIDYGVAKAGILQMVRYQAVMLAPSGVRVNSIVPGTFPNPAGQGDNTEFIKKLSEKVPMARVGNAEEIVGAVVFLASDAASYITGTEIVVDGGCTIW